MVSTQSREPKRLPPVSVVTFAPPAAFAMSREPCDAEIVSSQCVGFLPSSFASVT